MADRLPEARWFEAWRIRNHDRLMREARPPSLRASIKRLWRRFDAWLESDESELDWSADEAKERQK